MNATSHTNVDGMTTYTTKLHWNLHIDCQLHPITQHHSNADQQQPASVKMKKPHRVT
jgi:hypothetical protein